ncbi:hypothetical protein [Glutamicibacter sp. X7]
MAPEIRMRALISGSRNGKKWPKPGQTLEVPEAEAAQLIAQGIATAVEAEENTSAPKAKIETAVTGNVSLAAARKAEAELKAKIEAELAEAEAEAKAGAEAKAAEEAQKAEAEAKAKQAEEESAKAAAAKPAAKGKA